MLLSGESDSIPQIETLSWRRYEMSDMRKVSDIKVYKKATLNAGSTKCNT